MVEGWFGLVWFGCGLGARRPLACRRAFSSTPSIRGSGAVVDWALAGSSLRRVPFARREENLFRFWTWCDDVHPFKATSTSILMMMYGSN